MVGVKTRKTSRKRLHKNNHTMSLTIIQLAILFVAIEAVLFALNYAVGRITGASIVDRIARDVARLQ